MKKIVLLVAFVLTIISCSKVAKGEFLISGTAKGFKDGTKILLQSQDEKTMRPITIDSAVVKGEKFELKGKTTEPKMEFISLPETNNGFSVIIETGEIKVDVDKDSIQNTKVGGTYNNDELTSFNKNMKPLQKKMQDFQKKNMQAYQQAAQANDTVTLNKINKDSETVQKEFKSFFQKYAETHPKSLLSLYMIQTMFRNPDFDLAKTKKLFTSMDKELQNTTMGKKVKEQFDQLEGKTTPATPASATTTTSKPTVGGIAPDFTAPNPDGKMVSLKQSMGKVTLIDFWASWCGPCRKENPNVVAAYNEFHAKGFNIIGVSLDDTADKWKEAIAKDKLSWAQVSNLKKWSDPIAQAYAIEQIPSSFLLDSSGKIVATDLRGEELKAKIASLLK